MVPEKLSVEMASGQSEGMAGEETPHKELEEKSFRTFGISDNRITNTHNTNFKTENPLLLDAGL